MDRMAELPSGWPRGDSEMARLMREHDWAATPLGPVESWPRALQTIVEVMLEAPQIASVAVGPERLLLYNDLAARHYGARHPEVLGQPLAEGFTDQWPIIAGFYDRAFAGEAVRVEAQAVDSAGTGTPEVYDASLTPVRDDDGRVLAVFCTFVAAGDRLQAVRDLCESEERLRNVLDGMDEAFGLLDHDFRILAFNKAALRLKSRPGAEIVGRTHWEVYPGSEDGEIGRVLKRAMTERQPVSLEHFYTWEDGTARWLEMWAYPVPGGLAVFWRDISERKATEAALRERDEHNAFLVRFSDAVRGLSEPARIQETACRLLAERLGTQRTLWATLDWATREYVTECVVDGARRVEAPPRWPIDPQELFAVEHLEGRAVAYDDTATDPRIPDATRAAMAERGMRAGIAAPVVIEGVLRAVLNTNQPAAPRHWRSEEVAFAEALAGRAWAEIERARAENALRASEAKFRTLFETMGQGYALGEVIRDDEGRAIDLRYLELNPAFERLSGIPVAQAQGRTVREVYGTVEPEWIEVADRVARLKVPERVEYEIGAIGRWFQMHFYPAPGDRYLGLYEEITERKRQEFNAALLAEIGQDLAQLTAPDEIIEAVGVRLGRSLHLSGCIFADVDEAKNEATIHHGWNTAGVASLKQTFRLGDYFGEEFRRAGRAGETVVVRDTQRDERANAEAYARLNLGSFVTVPFLRQGRWVANITATTREGRDWHAQDVELLQEVASRVFPRVERARAEAALRDSEARLAAAFESVPVGAAVMDASGRAVLSNAEFDRFLPTGVIPSRDPAGVGRWRAWDAEGRPLAPQDFPGARALRGERVVPGQEMLYTDDNGREVWTSVSTVPIRDEVGRVTGLATVISDIDAAKRSADALREREERLRSFGEASSDVLWIRDADTLAWEYLSPAFEAIYGLSCEEALHGDTMRNWLDMIVPEDRERAQGEIEKARQGQRVTFEYRIIRPSDGEVRLLRNTDFPIRDAAGRVIRIGGVGHDATEEQATAERLKVLVHELQHRTRNLMGVVKGVTDKTLAGSTSLGDFQGRIRDRLGALTRVNGLLSRLNEGDRITFDELIRSELRGHGVTDGADHGPQVNLRGPKGVRLRSSTVQTLALGLHELATNALKYGALSQPSGRLDIAWDLVPGPDGQRRLRVEWRESGVAVADPDGVPLGHGEVVAPRRRGYGRELIERALPYQLKADTAYELTPEGVRCTITLPLSSTLGEGGSVMEDANA